MDTTLPQPNRATLEFNNAFASGVLGTLRKQTTSQFARAADEFQQRTGRPVESLEDVESILSELSVWEADTTWGGVHVRRMWRGMSEALGVHGGAVEAELKAVPLQGLGELRLNPDLKTPAFYAESEFHLVPGNYDTTWMYPFLNELPLSGVVTKRSWPEVKEFFASVIPPGPYRRIVDLGCGLGRSTVALKELFPEAEVIGIDFSEPELRYAHWESERRGLAITYLQEDAASTSIESGSADIVMAYIFHHEFPAPEMRRIIAEAYRMLAPGGLFLNGDVTPNRHMLPLTRYLLGRQVESGAEPFWNEAGDMDLPADYRAAGFTDIREEAPPKHPHGLHFPWWTIGRKG